MVSGRLDRAVGQPFFEGLSDIQAAYLRQCPQVFAVVSWGCAATQWIAKVLNGHPEIFCVHGSNLVWHVLGKADLLDGVSYLRVVGSEGTGHAAAGDVHGVSAQCIPEARRIFGDKFNAAVVVREPVPRLRSNLAFFEEFKEYYTPDLRHVDGLLSRARLALPADSYAARFFVHAANMLNAILDERKVGTLYRSEDLTSSPQVLGEFVEEITRGRVSPTATWLEFAIETGRLNRHNQKVHPDQLGDWQIDVIRKVVDPRSWAIYESLGYTRPEFVTA